MNERALIAVPRPERPLLDEALRTLLEKGSGNVFLVSGEPGLGKSTFVEGLLAVCDDLSDRNVLTATGRCHDIDGLSRSYLPWKEILLDLDADRAAGKDLEKKRGYKAVLKELFDESGPEWIQNIPQIGEISAAILETARAIRKVEQIDVETGESRSLSLRERVEMAARETAGAWIGAIPVVGGLAEAVFKTSQRLASDRRGNALRNQEDFFILVMSRLRELARENPLVLFLDDLQWADPSTISLFYYIARNLHDRPYPLLLIATCRPEELRRGRVDPVTGESEPHPLREKLDLLERYEAIRTIELTPLDPAGVDRYLDERFPRNDFTAATRQQIARISGGNLLFLQETLSNLVDRGLLEERDGLWHLRELDLSQLPRTIEGVVRERYERIGDDLREILQIASVGGDEFSLEIVGAILEESSLKLHRKVDALVNRHALLRRSDRVVERLTKFYEFTHNLVQKYIYYSIESDFRREIHRLIAEALAPIARSSQSEEIRGEFAFHLGVGSGLIDETRRPLAGAPSAPVDAREEFIEIELARAASLAARFSNEEALASFELLRHLATTLGDAMLLARAAGGAAGRLETLGRTSEALERAEESLRIAGALDDRTVEIEALNRLGTILTNTGEYERARDIHGRELELATLLDDRGRMADATGSIALLHMFVGEYDRARELRERQRALAEACGDEGRLAAALGGLGRIALEQGDYPAARDAYQRMLTIAEKREDRTGIAAAVGDLGIAEELQGNLDAAMRNYQRMLEICTAMGDRRGIGGATGRIGTIHIERGEHDRGIELLQQQVAISEEIGNRRGVAVAIGNIGNAHLDRREFDEAMRCYRRKLEISEELNDRVGIATALGNMAGTLAGLARYDEALEAGRRQLAICTEIGERSGISFSLGVIGYVEALRGHLDAAEEALTQKLEITRAMHDRREEAYALGNLGFCAHERGDLAGALGLFAQALELHRSIDYRPGELEWLALIALTAFEAGAVAPLREASEHYGRLVEQLDRRELAVHARLFSLMALGSDGADVLPDLESLLATCEDEELAGEVLVAIERFSPPDARDEATRRRAERFASLARRTPRQSYRRRASAEAAADRPV